MLGLRLVIFGLGLVKFGSGQTRVKFSSHFSVNFDLIHGWWSSACKNHWQNGGAVHVKSQSGWKKLYLGLLAFSKL